MTFPKEFIWGAAAASYQIEGNTQGVDGCGESVWDMVCKKEGFVRGGDTGFQACDSYNRYEGDVAIMKEMGLKAYRLSMMWPRIMPEGVGAVNEKGLAYYDRLIDTLLEAGIQPWVTLFHWDYPLALFNKGGWLNEDSSDWFAEYAKVVVDRFSDRVSHWFTLNEPECFIGLGHSVGNHAPGLTLPLKEVNRVWHHALLAHGKSVQVIRQHAKLASTIGAAPCFRTVVPATESPEDIEAARLQTFNIIDKTMFNATWWLDPAFHGRYPEDGLELFGSDAPDIKAGDMEIIQQPLDFLGFNCYQSGMVKAGPDGQPQVVEYENDHPLTHFQWPVTPEALRWGCQFLNERYKKPIIVTENGLSLNDWVSIDGQVHDPQRIDFLSRYIGGVKRAIADGVDIQGYFQWSILDNFEWAEGYAHRFGLVHVDYKTQKRTVKDSGHWYREVIASNGETIDANSSLKHW